VKGYEHTDEEHQGHALSLLDHMRAKPVTEAHKKWSLKQPDEDLRNVFVKHANPQSMPKLVKSFSMKFRDPWILLSEPLKSSGGFIPGLPSLQVSGLIQRASHDWKSWTTPQS
jgi:uncharacterized protein (DUF1919 family)